jgi:hypothetical protein
MGARLYLEKQNHANSLYMQANVKKYTESTFGIESLRRIKTPYVSVYTTVDSFRINKREKYPGGGRLMHVQWYGYVRPRWLVSEITTVLGSKGAEDFNCNVYRDVRKSSLLYAGCPRKPNQRNGYQPRKPKAQSDRRWMNSATSSRLALLRSDGVWLPVVLNSNRFTLFTTLYQHSLTLRNWVWRWITSTLETS